MNTSESLLKKYEYKFPDGLIAQFPSSPRDSARLLIYNRTTKEIHFDTFRNLAHYLPPRSILVFNQTKVIPARFTVIKETGGKINLLYLSRDKKLITVLSDKKLTVGATLKLTNKFRFKVHSPRGKYYFLKPSFPISSFISLLDRFGRAPIPPYIKHTPLSRAELKKQYQTVFARTPGSVAAPTASLHFTKQLITNLKRAGHDIKFITLHVNLGTFAPVTKEQMNRGKLHSEWYTIDRRTAESLNHTKRQHHPIIAVGTTVVRALESATNTSATFRVKGMRNVPRLSALRGSTDLFIREGYRFKFVDGLITNFHVPRSSLLMLVSAFADKKTVLNLYQTAITKKIRLFSFGDGMLLC